MKKNERNNASSAETYVRITSVMTPGGSQRPIPRTPTPMPKSILRRGVSTPDRMDIDEVLPSAVVSDDGNLSWDSINLSTTISDCETPDVRQYKPDDFMTPIGQISGVSDEQSYGSNLLDTNMRQGSNQLNTSLRQERSRLRGLVGGDDEQNGEAGLAEFVVDDNENADVTLDDDASSNVSARS